MKRILELAVITSVLFVAVLMIVGLIIFKFAHLSIADAARAKADYGVNSSSLTLIESGYKDEVWIIPEAGSILAKLHRPSTLIAAVYIPAMILSLYEINRLAGKRKKSSYLAAGRQN